MSRSLKLVINNNNLISESEIFFNKEELKVILNLYSKMVSAGS